VCSVSSAGSAFIGSRRRDDLGLILGLGDEEREEILTCLRREWLECSEFAGDLLEDLDLLFCSHGSVEWGTAAKKPD